MQRRRALQVLGALAASAPLPVLGGASAAELASLGERVHEALERASPPPSVLTPAQHRAVTAAAEQIIPRTDTPGATDVRVADFVDVMLAQWYPAADRERFVAGLADLDARAKRAAGHTFAECDVRQQHAVLAALDSHVATLRRSDAPAADTHWFARLKYLTVWGYYTSRAGMLEELGEQFLAGHYDGNAPYTPRAETHE